MANAANGNNHPTINKAATVAGGAPDTETAALCPDSKIDLYRAAGLQSDFDPMT